MNMNNSLEGLFRDGLGSMAVPPPPNLWDKLDSHLASTDVSSMYRERFSKDTEEPPRGVWFAIQRQLWLAQFLRFNVARINAYYVAGALLAGVGLTYWATQSDVSAPLASTKIEQPIAKTSVSASQLAQATITPSAVKSQIIASNEQPNQSTVPLTVVAKTTRVKDTPVENKNNNQSPKQTISTFAFPENVTIVGDKQVCENTEHVYSIVGQNDPQMEIRWLVAANDGIVTQLSSNKIMVDWQKEGASQIGVQLLKNGQIAQTNYAVQVVENSSSKILGKTIVCEGTKSVSYRVDNKQDLNKMYTWQTTKNNTLTIIGNGFVKIDFASLGIDSVILAESNTLTGCNARIAIPVQIIARPTVDFTVREKGNGEFEFINASQCGKGLNDCKLTSKWIVADNAYSAQNIRYIFETSGSYTISLSVQDQNACVSSIDRDVQISVGKLYIPTAYSVSSRLTGFTPIGENLSSYKVEVYTVDNHKIWESNVIVDGKPSEAWDGTINGEKAPLGSYLWRVQASFKDGGDWKGILQNGQYKKSGSFLLLE